MEVFSYFLPTWGLDYVLKPKSQALADFRNQVQKQLGL
jgi:hypothetical protein